MKKILITILIFMTGFNIYSQNSVEKRFLNLTNRFIQLYNSEQFDSIQTLFSPALQLGFPMETSTPYFNRIKKDLGEIKGSGIPYIPRKNQAEIPLYFDNDTLDLIITLNTSNLISGFSIKKAKKRLKVQDRNQNKITLPFRGDWLCLWGGETESQNIHIVLSNQKHAFDFIVIDSAGKSYQNNGKNNEDYYAFGKEVYAPADGIITDVTNGVRDNEPKRVNPYFALGNSIIIKHSDTEYSVLAHFKQNSIVVKVGDKVKNGDLLGLCGNSGNSTESHIHYHLQNTPIIQAGIGIKVFFKELKLRQQKTYKTLKDYSPVKGDIIMR